MKKNVDKYIQNFDELNVLVRNTESEQMADVIETLLITAYQRGVKDTEDELDYMIDTEFLDLERAVNKKVEGKDFRQRVAEYSLDGKIDVEAISKVAETEWHRVYQQACMDAATRIGKETGRSVSKTWVTILDDKVRLTHEVLEGVDKPLGEKFYTIDGDSAMFPGDFENASNNVNCRCLLEFSYT